MKTITIILPFIILFFYSCSAPHIDEDFLSEEYYTKTSTPSVKINGSIKMQSKVDSLILELNKVQFKLLQMQLDYLTLSNNMMNLQLHSMELKLLQHLREHELLAIQEKSNQDNQEHTEKQINKDETLNYIKDENEVNYNSDNSKSTINKNYRKNLIQFSNIYEKGILDFYKKKYKEALNNFSSLLDLEDKDEDLIDNSYYWIGECYFAMGNYVEAIENFKKVIEIQESNKQADALIMLGQTYEKIGWKELAKETYNKLISEYPKSKHIKLAQSRLKKLH